MEELIIKYLHELGCSKQDILLLCICPAGGTLGCYLNASLFYMEYYRKSAVEEKSAIKINKIFNIFEVFSLVHRLTIGIITGLLVSLYFIGTLDNSISTVARIFGLSILFGYLSPNFWKNREKLIKYLVTIMTIYPYQYYPL